MGSSNCFLLAQILFPYDQFVELFNWDILNVPPCGLINCGNRYPINIFHCGFPVWHISSYSHVLSVISGSSGWTYDDHMGGGSRPGEYIGKIIHVLWGLLFVVACCLT